MIVEHLAPGIIHQMQAKEKISKIHGQAVARCHDISSFETDFHPKYETSTLNRPQNFLEHLQ